MKSKIKIFIFMMTPTLLVALLTGAGFFIGRYSIIRNFDLEIQNISRAFFLGDLLTEKEKRSLVSVYRNAENILPEMDRIAWAVPTVPTPFVGTAPMPGDHGTAHINSMQFRSEREIEMPKPEKRYRIFLTGGSTAFGSGAPGQEKTISGYLNQILIEKSNQFRDLDFEIFTVANPAWTSTHERIMVENRLVDLEPDLIVSFSGVNDVHWGKMGRNSLWFRTYQDEYFLNLIKEVYRITGQPDIPEVAGIDPDQISPSLVTERLLRNVRISSYLLSDKGISYLFVLQPALAVTDKQLTKRERAALANQEYFEECYALIDRALRNLHGNGFQYANLSDVFDDIGAQEEIFLDAYHFGDKGNRIIAEKIFLGIKDLPRFPVFESATRQGSSVRNPP